MSMYPASPIKTFSGANAMMEGMGAAKDYENSVRDNLYGESNSILAQYQKMLQGSLGSQLNMIDGSLNKSKAVAADRIQQNSTQQKASGTQSLISRGLGNTTIADAMNRGVNSDTERAMQSNDAQYTQMGAQMKLSPMQQYMQSLQQIPQMQNAALSRYYDVPQSQIVTAGGSFVF